MNERFQVVLVNILTEDLDMVDKWFVPQLRESQKVALKNPSFKFTAEVFWDDAIINHSD